MVEQCNTRNRITTRLREWSLVGALFISGVAQSQSLSVIGTDWAPVVPKITEAGSDYAGTYESKDDLIIISGGLPNSFLSLLGSGSAKVSINFVPSIWNGGLHLFAKRNGGTAAVTGICLGCSATINDGVGYVEIPQGAFQTLFTVKFTGVLGLFTTVNFSGVNIKLKLSGVSVVLPVANYSGTIFFTIGAT